MQASRQHRRATEDNHTTAFSPMISQQSQRLLRKLTGGDRRSVGRANEVVAEVLHTPSLFDVLFDGLKNDDRLVKMRAADALEKVTAKQPEWLKPYKKRLLRLSAAADQQEVRWHMAQMLPRLALTPVERGEAARVLKGYLNDASSIVRTCALQALAELSDDDGNLREEVVRLLRSATRTGSPAMKSRARRLLERLGANPRLTRLA